MPFRHAPQLQGLLTCRLSNAAIQVFYFMLGIALKFPYVAQRQYLRRVLRPLPASQGFIIGAVAQILWNLELFYVFYVTCGLLLALVQRLPKCFISYLSLLNYVQCVL